MKKIKQRTQLERVCTEKGESIEEVLRRLEANKEKVPMNVPPIYTPMKDGVIPDYDIRADRFEIAAEATDKFAASETAKGAEMALIEEMEKDNQQVTVNED